MDFSIFLEIYDKYGLKAVVGVIVVERLWVYWKKARGRGQYYDTSDLKRKLEELQRKYDQHLKDSKIWKEKLEATVNKHIEESDEQNLQVATFRAAQIEINKGVETALTACARGLENIQKGINDIWSSMNRGR